MFEDSTFESTGRIKTRSRRWMFATLVFNGSILVALILIPLIYPNALPSHYVPPLLVAPEAPKPETPQARPHAAQHGPPERNNQAIVMPTQIPKFYTILKDREQPFSGHDLAMDNGPSVPGVEGASPFGTQKPVVVVHPDIPKTVHVASSLIEGLLVYKNVPPYPSIAKATGVQGTVVLQAKISKAGTIENLHVVSGPIMLQQAALDAVKAWRYRPYLLNQQPVEVETTVSVIFKLER